MQEVCTRRLELICWNFKLSLIGACNEQIFQWMDVYFERFLYLGCGSICTWCLNFLSVWGDTLSDMELCKAHDPYTTLHSTDICLLLWLLVGWSHRLLAKQQGVHNCSELLQHTLDAR